MRGPMAIAIQPYQADMLRKCITQTSRCINIIIQNILQHNENTPIRMSGIKVGFSGCTIVTESTSILGNNLETLWANQMN